MAAAATDRIHDRADENVSPRHNTVSLLCQTGLGKCPDDARDKVFMLVAELARARTLVR